MSNLETSIYTLPIKNPIVVGSSGISDSAEKIIKIANSGAGAIVMKSIFEEEIDFQYKEEMKKLSDMDSNLEFLDYYDYQLRSQALTKYCNEIKKAKKIISIPLIASISCFSAGEWINFAKPIEEAGADALEINAFFLPIDESKSAEDYEALYVDIVTKLKANLDIPVGIKIGSYFSHLPNFVARLSKVADGVTIFNRFFNPDINLDTHQITNGHIFSSSSDYHNTLRWVSLLSKKLPDSISASTGIQDAETVIKMILAGATSTQIVSGIYLHGLKVIDEMLVGLLEYMKQHGFDKIEDFKGRMQSDTKTQNYMERVQFMKYFGEGSSMIDI